MKSAHLLIAAGLLGAAASASNAMTIATFADPSLGVPSLFEWNATTSTLTGGYTGTGLTLETPGLPGGDHPQATFSMAPMVATMVVGQVALFGPGSVQFFDSAANPIFTISFDSAVLNSSLSFGASDFTGFNVSFSGSILEGLVPSEEAFAFSFANPVSTQNGFTVTSSFTSSATLVPTPGSVAMMALGGACLTRRRRSAKR